MISQTIRLGAALLLVNVVACGGAASDEGLASEDSNLEELRPMNITWHDVADTEIRYATAEESDCRSTVASFIASFSLPVSSSCASSSVTFAPGRTSISFEYTSPASTRRTT